jgi:hypothetical protein
MHFQLYFISIQNPDSDLELSIELYDMGAIANAIGIFAAQRDDDQALKKLENAHFFPTSVGAIGILNNFYFKITGNQRNSQAVEKSIAIIQALNGIRSDSGKTSKIFDVFANRLNIPFARITYERQDVFQFDFARDFWFARPPSASDYRYFAHEAASQEDARELYDRLLEENLFDNTLVNQKDHSVVMKHNFLNTLLSLNLNDTYAFGVENAPDETVLRRSLGSLSEALIE